MNETTDEIVKLCPSLKPFLSAKESEASEYLSVQTLGIPASLLMENAGLQVSEKVIQCFKQFPQTLGKTALIFCGPGNNGGDALVCARHLLGRDIELILCLVLGNKSSQERKFQLDRLQQIIKHTSTQVRIIHDSKQLFFSADHVLKNNTIIVDGLLGAGINRAPEGEILKSIMLINELRERFPEQVRVIAIDVPSGCTLEAASPLGACVRADRCITFEWLKRVHVSEPTKLLTGHAEAKAIGLFSEQVPHQYLIAHHCSLKALLKPLKPNSHKGCFGHVAVIEGNRNYSGASRLAAKAALKAGAGLLSIVTKEKESMHPYDLPEFMKRFSGDADELFWSKINAMVLGPGLGRTPEQLRYGKKLGYEALKSVPTLVLDADALQLLDEQEPWHCETLILTPHPKEAAQILGESVQAIEANRFLAIERLGRLKIHEGNNTIWVLKGASSLVLQTQSGKIFAFEGNVPLLATGGSGDTLAGAIAALISQAQSPLAATLLAVQLLITAAFQGLSQGTRGILPSELSDRFPALLKRPFR